MVIALSFLNYKARINSAQRQTRSLILKVFVCMGMEGSLLKNSLTAIKKKNTYKTIQKMMLWLLKEFSYNRQN